MSDRQQFMFDRAEEAYESMFPPEGDDEEEEDYRCDDCHYKHCRCGEEEGVRKLGGYEEMEEF